MRAPGANLLPSRDRHRRPPAPLPPAGAALQLGRSPDGLHNRPAARGRDDVKHYMDLFDASALPATSRRTVAGSVVPELIETIHRHNLVPRLGHDLSTIADIQRRNANRMRLFQPFNPEFQDYDDSNAVVMTIERDGEPVACAGTRLI